jgi:hypothetical protein
LEIKRRLNDTWSLDIENFSPSFDKRTPSPILLEDEPMHHILGVTQPNIAHLSFMDFLGSLFGISYDLRFTDEIHVLDDIENRNSIIGTKNIPLEVCIEGIDDTYSSVILEHQIESYV